MKKLLAVLISLCMVLSMSIFAACDDKEIPSGPVGPAKLATPFVTVSSEGVASWNAVANALGYTYKIDDGAEVNTASTSVQLEGGQSIRVKAVGDGSSYTDSDYSSAQTYTAPSNPDDGDNGGNTPSNPDDGDNGNTPSTPDDGGSGGNTPSNPDDGDNGGNTPTNPDDGGSGGNTPSNPDDGGNGGNTPSNPDDGGNGGNTPSNPDDGGNGGNTPSNPDDGGSGGNTPSNPDDGGNGGNTPSTPDATAPTFLEISASTTNPDPNVQTASVRSKFEYMDYGAMRTAVSNFITDPENAAGDAAPTEYEYTAYATHTSTIYVQIWLNNPEQYTILSLKLNGIKYQVGGALRSFFDGTRNCVYVQLITPAEGYTTDYTVSEIEYVDGSSVSQNGKQVFIGEDDTVTVGLYTYDAPSVGEITVTTGCYTADLEVTVNDTTGIIAYTGGWLRALVYDGTSIVTQQKLTANANDVQLEGLDPDEEYLLILVAYYDKRVGNGVEVYELGGNVFETKPIAEFIEEGTSGDYARIEGVEKAELNIQAVVHDSEKTFEKIYIYFDNDDDIVTGGGTIDPGNGDGTVVAPGETVTTPGGEVVVTPGDGSAADGAAGGATVVVPGGDGTVTDGTVAGDGTTIIQPTVTPKTPDIIFEKTDLEEMGFDGTMCYTDGILSGKKYVVRVYYTETEYIRTELDTPAYVAPQAITSYDFYTPISFKNHIMSGIEISRPCEQRPDASTEQFIENFTFKVVATYNGEEKYSFTFDANDQDEFFNTGYYRFTDDCGVSSRNDRYYFIVRNYYQLSEEVRNNLVWTAYVTADLNDGWGEREYDYELYYYMYGGGLDTYGPEIELDGNSLTVSEAYEGGESYFPRGYIYKVTLNPRYDETPVKTLYVNDSYVIDEESWIEGYKQLIADAGNDPSVGWRGGDGGHYGEAYYRYTSPLGLMNLPGLNEYLGDFTEEREVLQLTVDTTGVEPGYYQIRTYTRDLVTVYEAGAGDMHYHEPVITVSGGKLGAPTVSFGEQYYVVEWTEVPNATSYKIFVNGEEKETIYDTRYNVMYVAEHGDSIEVLAVGSGDYGMPAIYEDSDKSNVLTYNIPQLATPVISLQGYTLTFDDVENANRYVLEVVGEEGEHDVYSGMHMQQFVGKTIRIKACGGSYRDSEWSSSVTVTTPTYGGSDGK